MDGFYRFVASKTAHSSVASPGLVVPVNVTGNFSPNTRHAGADEDGIVKLHGSRVVIQRHGRLFIVSMADGDREPSRSP